MKQITYSKVALRAFAKIPKNTAVRIRNKIVDYATDPTSQANNVKKLKGMNAIRLRVGDWRVVMEDGVVLEIRDVGPRGGIYD